MVDKTRFCEFIARPLLTSRSCGHASNCHVIGACPLFRNEPAAPVSAAGSFEITVLYQAFSVFKEKGATSAEHRADQCLWC